MEERTRFALESALQLLRIERMRIVGTIEAIEIYLMHNDSPAGMGARAVHKVDDLLASHCSADGPGNAVTQDERKDGLNETHGGSSSQASRDLTLAGATDTQTPRVLQADSPVAQQDHSCARRPFERSCMRCGREMYQ